MAERPTEVKPIDHTAATGKGVIKGSLPEYREGAETPVIKQVLEKAGVWSRESPIKLKTPDGTAQGSRRPLSLRRTRRELMGKIHNTPAKLSDEQKQEIQALKQVTKPDIERIQAIFAKKNELRKKIAEAGRARDAIAEQLASDQDDVSVEVGDLGIQSARFVVLTPPESRRSKAQDGKPPIIFISGISADVETGGMFPQESASYAGRDVVIIGYPDSWHGNVTDAFGKAAEESSSYEPHTTFFKEAIKAILERQDVKAKIGDVSEIDLWGHSTGAAIIAEILTDRQFRERVANAVLIAPPSCVDQRNPKIFGREIPLPGAIISELWDILKPKNIRNAAKINVANRHEIQYTKDHRRRELRSHYALRKKPLRRNNWWKKDLGVKEGGTIIVVSYDHDQMTKTYKVVDEIAQNPNLHIIKLPGSHTTPLRKPLDLIRAVSKITNPPFSAAA